MDNYQAAGDLTDIVWAGASSNSNVALPSSSMANWGEFASISDTSNVVVAEEFGDPFSDTRDPLLHDVTVPAVANHDREPTFAMPFVSGEDGSNKRSPPSSCGIFSRILQVTAPGTGVTPRPPSCEASPLVTVDGSVPPLGAVKCSSDFNYSNGSGNLLASTMMLDRSVGGMMQISSPRNPGMKRRKSQAKKVVCIPAPAAANSRPSGEVVPSDLWAWRKYGQKPIKGSPYPRGYYRCSSSKGCSARKQVERSRTDPNMLVITYTSEHNHPWPTQRNALAGSTRSQPSKSNSISKNSANNSHPGKPAVAKGEEHNGNSSDDNMSSTAMAAARGSSATTTSVKEETKDDVERQFDMEDVDLVGDGLAHCYRPSMLDSPDHPDDFFADLQEIEADPYELLFNQGFPGDDQHRGNKSLDPFNLLDWSDENNGTSFGEANKKGL